MIKKTDKKRVILSISPLHYNNFGRTYLSILTWQIQLLTGRKLIFGTQGKQFL